jgi:hypothetical protein
MVQGQGSRAKGRACTTCPLTRTYAKDATEMALALDGNSSCLYDVLLSHLTVFQDLPQLMSFQLLL